MTATLRDLGEFEMALGISKFQAEGQCMREIFNSQVREMENNDDR
jgi:hypothetical protein